MNDRFHHRYQTLRRRWPSGANSQRLAAYGRLARLGTAIIAASCFCFAISMSYAGPPGVASQENGVIHWRANHAQVETDDAGESVRSALDSAIRWRLAGNYQWAGNDKMQALCWDGTTTSLLADSADMRDNLPKGEFTVESMVLVEQPGEWGAMVGYLQDNGEFEKGWLLGYHGHLFTFALATDGANQRDSAGDGTMTYLSDQKSFQVNNWYHVAGTYDGEKMRLYIDGELRATSDAQQGPILYPASAQLAIGSYVDQDEHYRLHGMLHEVVIEPFVRNESELRERSQLLHEAVRALPLATPPPERPAVGPIVRMVAADQAEVQWRDMPSSVDAGAHRMVRYGTSGRHGRRADVRLSDDWKMARLVGLAESSDHEFQIESPMVSNPPRQGKHYRFDTSHGYLRPQFPAFPSPYGPNLELERRVAQMLQLSGWQAGHAIVLGATDGHLAYELARQSQLQVTIIEPDEQRVNAIRRRLAAVGLYGTHITVHLGDPTKLPYTDYCANLLIAQSAIEGRPFQGDRTEAMRIVRPAGGAAFLEQADFAAPQFRADLPGAGHWTHQYGEADNSTCSKDDVVRSNVAVQWWGPPGPHPMPDRGGRNPSPLSVAGYLFTQGDRILFGQDAYNGTIYWTLMIPEMRRSNIPRDCGNMAAAADMLYVAVTGHCLCIDPRTGTVRQVFDVEQPATSAQAYDWGFVGYVEDTLVGTPVVAGGAYVADAGEWYEDYEPVQIAKVVSPLLFAMNRHTGEHEWKYERGAIVNSTITLDAHSIYFVESRNVDVIKSAHPRQSHGSLQRDQFLVAIDRRTGQVRWERPVDLTSCDFMTYMAYAENKLVISGTDRDRTFHHFAFDASTGQPTWERHDSTGKTHHSGHLDHLVIIGNKIYSNLHVMDLHSGKEAGPQFAERRGCGIMAGSNHMLFFRDHFHGMWDLASDRRWEFHGIRPGCWLGMIPAGGVVLAPESSSGCSCTHAIQTSVGFRPVPVVDANSQLPK